MKPTCMIQNVHLSFLVYKNPFIMECIKHSNNNREALTLNKYVNNGTSAKVTSSAGIFHEPISRGQ